VRIAIDTNVLVYAEDVSPASRMRRAALSLLERLPEASVVLPVQVLAELYYLLVRKARLAPAKARHIVLNWSDSYETIDTSTAVMLAATDVAASHKLSIWDSLVLSSAAEAGCRLLLSEDMQEGFTLRGVTVINPFAVAIHPLLQAVLTNESR